MKAVLQNLASVLGGEAAVRFGNFAAILFIARKYGGAVFGAYAVSLAIVTVVVMFADNGLQTAAITQLSAANFGRDHVVGRLTFAKTAMLGVSLRAVFQSYSQLQMAILKSISLANAIVIIQSLHSSILFLGIWFAFKLNWSIFALLEWLTFCQIVELGLGAGVLYQSGILSRWPKRLYLIATLKL